MLQRVLANRDRRRQRQRPGRLERLNPKETMMQIPKDQILQLLRDRGDHDTAQNADQQLPDTVDTEQHAGQLGQLGINPTDLLGGLGGKLGL